MKFTSKIDSNRVYLLTFDVWKHLTSVLPRAGEIAQGYTEENSVSLLRNHTHTRLLRTDFPTPRNKRQRTVALWLPALRSFWKGGRRLHSSLLHTWLQLCTKVEKSSAKSLWFFLAPKKITSFLSWSLWRCFQGETGIRVVSFHPS